MVRSGSDNAYGIYLSQMLFITALTWLGWERLSSAVPWPLLCVLTVAIVFASCMTLTSVLARTRLAVPLTGRRQQPWSTLIPLRRAPGDRSSASTTCGARRSGPRLLAMARTRLPAVSRNRKLAGHGRAAALRAVQGEDAAQRFDTVRQPGQS